jgi:hypothetical protein
MSVVDQRRVRLRQLAFETVGNEFLQESVVTDRLPLPWIALG